MALTCGWWASWLLLGLPALHPALPFAELRLHLGLGLAFGLLWGGLHPGHLAVVATVLLVLTYAFLLGLHGPSLGPLVLSVLLAWLASWGFWAARRSGASLVLALILLGAWGTILWASLATGDHLSAAPLLSPAVAEASVGPWVGLLLGWTGAMSWRLASDAPGQAWVLGGALLGLAAGLAFSLAGPRVWGLGGPGLGLGLMLMGVACFTWPLALRRQLPAQVEAHPGPEAEALRWGPLARLQPPGP